MNQFTIEHYIDWRVNSLGQNRYKIKFGTHTVAKDFHSMEEANSYLDRQFTKAGIIEDYQNKKMDGERSLKALKHRIKAVKQELKEAQKDKAFRLKRLKRMLG